MLADMMVFPTPVSVPVIKIAFTDLIDNRGKKDGNAYKYTGTDN